MNATANLEDESSKPNFACFSQSKRIAEGTLADVALAAWQLAKTDPTLTTLTFNRQSGAVVDLDLRGSAADIIARYSPEAEPSPKRGRPKLGVVAREVTLLPRHWDWLAGQPGGASVALRKLVEAARKQSAQQPSLRDRQAAAYKFMSAIAGDLLLFEEASRALFAQDTAKLEACVATWPADIQGEVRSFLAGNAPQRDH